MRMTGAVSEFVSSPEAMAQYRAWLELPMTSVVRRLLAGAFAPPGLAAESRTGDSALYYAGYQDACAEILRAFGDLARLAASTAGQKSLVMDYGAGEILEQGE